MNWPAIKSVVPAPLLASALLLAAAPAAAAEPTPAQRLVRQNRVLVIAHRGASSVAPENTLPAFRAALRARADLVELDYYHSADGAPIVFHDKELDRTTNARTLFGGEKIPVGSKTLADLRRLDAGSWFGAKFAGTTLPTLEEALDVIQSGSTTLIERKGGDAAACVALLERKRLLQDVVVQSFDWDYVADCHRRAPSLTLAALGHDEVTPKQLDQIERTGAKIVGWSEQHLGAEQIEAFHARGWKVWAYTIDDPRRAQELIDAGLDGVITNKPSAMLALLRQQAAGGK